MQIWWSIPSVSGDHKRWKLQHSLLCVTGVSNSAENPQGFIVRSHSLIEAKGISGYVGWNFLFVFFADHRWDPRITLAESTICSHDFSLASSLSPSVRFSPAPGGLQLNLPWLLIHQSCLTNSQLARHKPPPLPSPPQEPLSGRSSILIRVFCNDWDLVLLIVI